MKYFYVCIILLSWSCSHECDVAGLWERVEFPAVEEIIPSSGSIEIGIPLGQNLKLRIDKDSLHLIQDSLDRAVIYKIEGDLFIFPDSLGLGIYWKIIKCDSQELIFKRSKGGIDPVWEKLKFKRMATKAMNDD